MFKSYYEVVFNEHVRVHSVLGSPVAPTYILGINEDGKMDLIESGKVNIYDQIQSHKDSVDINLMISRFANGDVNALNGGNPMYLDVTEFPKSLAEMYSLVINAKATFEKLPIEVRDAFGHSPETFISMLGSDEYNSIMSKFSPVSDKPIEEGIVLDKVDKILEVNE